MTDKDKLGKLRKLADAMYYAAQQLTTDASRLRKTMEDYHQFIIQEWHEPIPIKQVKARGVLRKMLDDLDLEQLEKTKQQMLKEASEEPKPKFKVGDIIKFKGVHNEDVTRVITNIQKGEGGGFRYLFADGSIHSIGDDEIELVEEPVSEDEIEKQFKIGDVVMYVSRHPAYSGLYILGNPNDLSIGYSNANESYQIALRNCTIASEEERNQFMRDLNSNGYRWNEDTLRIEKEEPASEDMWEASKQYALRQVLASTDTDMCELAYLDLRLFSGFELAVAHKDGANWQKQQMLKNAYDAYVSYIRENSEAVVHLKNTSITMSCHFPKKDLEEGDQLKVVVIKQD